MCVDTLYELGFASATDHWHFRKLLESRSKLDLYDQILIVAKTIANNAVCSKGSALLRFLVLAMYRVVLILALMLIRLMSCMLL